MKFQLIQFSALVGTELSHYVSFNYDALLSSWIMPPMLYHVPLYEIMWSQRKCSPSLPVSAVMIRLENENGRTWRISNGRVV
jgi:hypothetical protein